MSEMIRAIPILLVVAVFSGCVTSETRQRPMAPSDDAAEQNFQLGSQYFRNGNYELARARLERAIELDSRHANSHSMLALTLVQLGKKRLAMESFDRAIRIAPNNHDVRNAYAVFLCQERRFDEAIEQFDRAIRLRENDDSHVMMTNAGVCMAQKPDLAQAERYFRDALERRATYGEALIQLAALKHGVDDNLAARAFLQRFLASNPSSPGVLYLAVQVETRLGDDRAATEYMNQLLREFPDSEESRLVLRQAS